MKDDYDPTQNQHILTQTEWEFNSLIAYAKQKHLDSNESRIMDSLFISITRKLENITLYKTNPKMFKASQLWENDEREECRKISAYSWEFLNKEQRYEVFKLYELEGKL